MTQSGKSSSKLQTENPPPPDPDSPDSPEYKPVPETEQLVTHKQRPGKYTTPTPKFNTPLSVAFRPIKPSWRNYIQYVSYAAKHSDSDEDRAEMQKYLDAYTSLPRREQYTHFPEQIIDLTGVRPDVLIRSVCWALWVCMEAERNMVASIAAPEIMNAIVKNAKSPDGYKDRELFLRTSGSLPDKGGQPVRVTVVNNALLGAGADPGPGGTRMVRVGNEVNGLAAFDDEVIDITRQLETGQIPKAPANAPASANESANDVQP